MNASLSFLAHTDYSLLIYRRVFRGLQALTSPKSDSVSKLSKNVAVEQLVINVTVEEAIKRVHRNIVAADDLATSISKWAPEPTGGPGKVLNGGQKRAMDMALGRKFQLIQGPPGMYIVSYFLSLLSLRSGKGRGICDQVLPLNINTQSSLYYFQKVQL